MMKPAPAQGEYDLAADYAYAMLRQGIEEGRYLPGCRMREIELAKQLGVSRTPVRQALSRLELEGMLSVGARGGLSVARLDIEAIAELYDMREALEATAARFAARNAAPRQIEMLHAALSHEPPENAEPSEFARHNKQLHQTICEAANNRFLTRAMQALHDALALLGPTTLEGQERRRRAHEEHAELVKAIARRDETAAANIAQAHIRNAYLVRLERVKQASLPGS